MSITLPPPPLSNNVTIQQYKHPLDALPEGTECSIRSFNDCDSTIASDLTDNVDPAHTTVSRSVTKRSLSHWANCLFTMVKSTSLIPSCSPNMFAASFHPFFVVRVLVHRQFCWRLLRVEYNACCMCVIPSLFDLESHP